MPYQTIVFEKLVKEGFSIHVFYLDKKQQTPFVPPQIENVFYYKKNPYTSNGLLDFVSKLNPILLVVAGWSDKVYLRIARHFKRRRNIPVVSLFDTQFLGRLKQILGIIASPLYIRTAFTHLWVPGFRQYEFARLLGYKRNQIIFNSLSGDVELFSSAYPIRMEKEYPKRFLYAGRFSKEKGLDILLEAWESIVDKKDWKLTLVGNGPEEQKLKGHKSVEILPFMDQKKLVELASQSGCFVLPSTYEPWALVLQEFSASGLPIICSEACGAMDIFLINGFNGFSFKTFSHEDLKRKLLLIINRTGQELRVMSANSYKLSKRITPEISAKSVLSLVCEKGC